MIPLWPAHLMLSAGAGVIAASAISLGASGPWPLTLLLLAAGAAGQAGGIWWHWRARRGAAAKHHW
jgi:hypothetical protein